MVALGNRQPCICITMKTLLHIVGSFFLQVYFVTVLNIKSVKLRNSVKWHLGPPSKILITWQEKYSHLGKNGNTVKLV